MVILLVASRLKTIAILRERAKDFPLYFGEGGWQINTEFLFYFIFFIFVYLHVWCCVFANQVNETWRQLYREHFLKQSLGNVQECRNAFYRRDLVKNEVCNLNQGKCSC